MPAGSAEARDGMQGGAKVCKTVRQHSRGKISSENMDALMGIGHGCMAAKNYIYQKYGGIKSLVKVHSGYGVDSEVRSAGFREKLGLPSVYFTAAVDRALGDIKIMWAQIRNGIRDAANKNGGLSPEDRHYIRFVLKTDVCYWNVLNGKSAPLPEKIQPGYEKAVAELGGDGGGRIKSLNSYIRRQTRKRLHRQHSDSGLRFAIKKQGYRYGEQDGERGIFLAAKESRRRMFIPLTDANSYDRVLEISLDPQKKSVEIAVPVFVNVRRNEGCAGEIGISLGLWNMIATSTGNIYGSDFGRMQREISRFILEENCRNKAENISETRRYQAKKRKMDEALKNYVNMEINRMLAREKPEAVYMAKLPANAGMLMSGSGDTHLLRMWKKGPVTERLQWKCRKDGIKIVEVLGNGIGRECSACGQDGYAGGGKFKCPACGFEEDRKVNGARNALNRGRTGKQINETWSGDAPGR